MKRLLIACLLLVGVSYAYAQNPVVTRPQGVTSYNASSTIAVTNTFQSIWAASTAIIGRTNCTVQNNGTNAMYVYFGAIANATTANSIKLTTGQSVNCASGGIVLKDQVSITGTSGDAFFAAQQ